MKKLVLLTVIAFLAIGAASAQGWGRGGGWGMVPQIQPQAISVTGTLQLRNGVIAVVSDNNTYYVPVLTQYVGFIEGLREGAQISMDGYMSGNYFQPNKVTINGRNYDFTVNSPQNVNYPQNYSCCGGYGYMSFR